MSKFRENLKTVGVFNALLVLVIVVMQVVDLCNPVSVVLDAYNKVVLSFFMIALLFGAFYAADGYQKNSAVFFKIYMFIGAFSFCLYAVMPFISEGPVPYVDLAIKLLCALALVLLAAIKNFGKMNSLFVSVAGMTVSLLATVLAIINTNCNFNALVGSLQGLMVMALAFAFVLAKYADKTERGREV